MFVVGERTTHTLCGGDNQLYLVNHPVGMLLPKVWIYSVGVWLKRGMKQDPWPSFRRAFPMMADLQYSRHRKKGIPSPAKYNRGNYCFIVSSEQQPAAMASVSTNTGEREDSFAKGYRAGAVRAREVAREAVEALISTAPTQSAKTTQAKLYNKLVQVSGRLGSTNLKLLHARETRVAAAKKRRLSVSQNGLGSTLNPHESIPMLLLQRVC